VRSQRLILVALVGAVSFNIRGASHEFSAGGLVGDRASATGAAEASPVVVSWGRPRRRRCCL